MLGKLWISQNFICFRESLRGAKARTTLVIPVRELACIQRGIYPFLSYPPSLPPSKIINSSSQQLAPSKSPRPMRSPSSSLTPTSTRLLTRYFSTCAIANFISSPASGTTSRSKTPTTLWIMPGALSAMRATRFRPPRPQARRPPRQ